jgi:WD40 repeat protein
MCTLTGHSGEVNSVAISPDGKRIVSGADDDLVKIWDTDTGAEVSSFVRLRGV